jgi:hypothetical protein
MRCIYLCACILEVAGVARIAEKPENSLCCKMSPPSPRHFCEKACVSEYSPRKLQAIFVITNLESFGHDHAPDDIAAKEEHVLFESVSQTLLLVRLPVFQHLLHHITGILMSGERHGVA